MGFIGRSASFVRFSIDGELPDNPLDYIAERIRAYSFQDIDDNFEEYSIGWVSVLNMFDSAFAYASYLNGDYVVLSLRMDERKVAPAILNKFVQKEEQRVLKEKQLPKLGRTARNEIKERIKTELTRKAIPVPSVYDLVWNLSESSLCYFTTNKKAHVLLEDFFKDCFGLLLMQQIPYVTAEHLLIEQDRLAQLERLAPEIFV